MSASQLDEENFYNEKRSFGSNCHNVAVVNISMVFYATNRSMDIVFRVIFTVHYTIVTTWT